jgi:ABC-type dipeptide/oligopeptide/nickel transport system permease component
VQGYTPLSEGIGPWLENLVLPATALGCVYVALIARMTRAAMLEDTDLMYTLSTRKAYRPKSLSERIIRPVRWNSVCNMGVESPGDATLET